MTEDEYKDRIEARLRAMETVIADLNDPADREIDEYIRRTLRAMITFAWLVRHLTVFAAAIIAAKLAWDTVLDVLRGAPK